MKKSCWPSRTVLGFVLPNLAGFLAFTFLPVIFSFVMAFTNWTLKPAVPLAFVGLRNFDDLLGMRPLGAADPDLLRSYVGCGLVVVAGVILTLWSQMMAWRGTRWGGMILLFVAAVLAGAALGRKSDHGFVLAAALVALLGLAPLLSERSAWGAGFGFLPPLIVAAAVLGLQHFHERMWLAYEPRDPRFWKYFYNTAYLMLSLPAAIAGSLGLALLLNNPLPLGGVPRRIVSFLMCGVGGVVTLGVFWKAGYPDAGVLLAVLWGIAGLALAFNVVAFRTIYYLPTFTSGVAIMILWKALYNPQTGPINVALSSLFHIPIADLPKWLSSTVWSKPALMFMGLWTGIGGTGMLLYLAGLSNISQDLLDAAEIDGAGGWQRIRHIVWPQLAPTTFFITIMSIIGGLQGGFEQARVMTAGGPDGATTTLSYYIYNKAFQDLDLGFASAIAWVMFAIIFVATALNWKFGKSLEVD